MNDHDDDLRPAEGVFRGLAYGLALWAFLVFAVWLFVQIAGWLA